MMPFLQIQGTLKIIILVNPLEGIRWKVELKKLLITPLYFRTRSCEGWLVNMSEKLLVRPMLHLPVSRVSGGSETPLAWRIAVWICLVSFMESLLKGQWNSIVAISEQHLITQVVVVRHDLISICSWAVSHFWWCIHRLGSMMHACVHEWK